MNVGVQKNNEPIYDIQKYYQSETSSFYIASPAPEMGLCAIRQPVRRAAH